MELVRLPHAAASFPRAACPQKRRIPARTPQAAFSNGRNQSLAAFFAAGNSNAWALDYNDIIQSTTTTTTTGVEDLDAAAIDGLDFSAVESVVSFISDNPAAVIGGAIAIALPILVSKIFGSSQVISAKEAFEKLGTNDPTVQLLDIRDSADIKVEGTPDLRKFKKRVVQLAYANEDDGFVKKVLTKFKDPANTTLYILDRFDGNSTKLAKLLANNGFKAAYAIKDGAEGQRGWQKSELPWLLPRKGLTLNLDVLKDVIQTDDLVPVSLGVAAAAGAGFVVFSEAETALQLVGTAALLQLFVKKFLFAEDRKNTFKQLATFLETKIAPKELVDDIKTLLPPSKEIPSAENGVATSTQEQTPAAEYPDIKPPSSPTPSPPTDGSPPIETSSSKLSPYVMYPDLKPPSSPSPSRP